MTEKIDVAIVGAGMAGINAAHDLSTKSRSVVLLEARNRPGGERTRARILADKSSWCELSFSGTTWQCCSLL